VSLAQRLNQKLILTAKQTELQSIHLPHLLAEEDNTQGGWEEYINSKIKTIIIKSSVQNYNEIN